MFDTSSIVYAWDNYPLEQFPILWGWLGDEIEGGHLTMPQKGFEELEKVDSNCANWVKSKNIERLSMNAAILNDALRIKNLLGIINNKYSPKDGVGEIDLYIIATARHSNAELISNESVQDVLPTKLFNCQIPAVCRLSCVGVSCINFLDFLKQSGKVFG